MNTSSPTSKYYVAVRKQRAVVAAHLGMVGVPLDEPFTSAEPCYITSIDAPDQDWSWRIGVVVDVTPEMASRRLAERTHRLSTPEEIEGYKASVLKQERECHAIEEKKKEKSIMAMPPELTELVKTLTAQALAAQLATQGVSASGKPKGDK